MLLTFFKLSFVIKIFFLSIYEWPFYTGFTVVLIFHVNGLQADDSNEISSGLSILMHGIISLPDVMSHDNSH